jgi:hypothetical protein
MAKSKNRISGITVCGYKSIFTPQTIGIAPLTILAGANSSGKSSIMQPLLLLKQTIEAPGDPGALRLDGDHVRFTSTEQLLSHPSGQAAAPIFTVEIRLKAEESLHIAFRREERKGFTVDRMIYGAGQERIEITEGMSHEAIIGILPEPWKSFHQDFTKRDKTARWSVFRDRCFLAFDLVSEKGPGRRIRFGPAGISPSADFVPFIQGIIHLPGLRGNPRRTYPKAAVGSYFQGTFEPYVASVIAKWQSEDAAEMKQLGAALEAMGLTWKVRAEPVDDTQVELRVGRLVHPRRGGARDLVSIADVGFGVSQSLPVVVSLIAARPGQLVYLEQPEIHLHPLAQRRLAGVLKDAVKRGVVAVVETHSALLLREIQTLIATGLIDKDEVTLHWVQRGKEDGATVVKTAELDDNGAYGDWPEDFDQTELQAEQAYLDAVEAKGAGK